jgi:hypothetical protein
MLEACLNKESTYTKKENISKPYIFVSPKDRTIYMIHLVDGEKIPNLKSAKKDSIEKKKLVELIKDIKDNYLSKEENIEEGFRKASVYNLIQETTSLFKELKELSGDYYFKNVKTLMEYINNKGGEKELLYQPGKDKEFYEEKTKEIINKLTMLKDAYKMMKNYGIQIKGEDLINASKFLYETKEKKEEKNNNYLDLEINLKNVSFNHLLLYPSIVGYGNSFEKDNKLYIKKEIVNDLADIIESIAKY